MNNQENSRYVQYLPRVYHKGSQESDKEFFLGRFLKAFEQVLSGEAGDKGEEALGIEALLNRFHQYFDPLLTPAQFLPWLAGWVGLDLEDGIEFYGDEDYIEKGNTPTQILPLDEGRSSINRDMIGRIVQLYKKRGTLEGLKECLQIYAGEESTISINEFEEPVRLGEAERIGINTMVGYAKPSYFSVHALIPAHSRSILQNKVRILREVIQEEKPFYTNFILNIEVPSMLVGVYSRLGRETLLGGMRQE